MYSYSTTPILHQKPSSLAALAYGIHVLSLLPWDEVRIQGQLHVLGGRMQSLQRHLQCWGAYQFQQ